MTHDAGVGMPGSGRSSITSIILVGYALILIALIGQGWHATREMEQLREITHNLYIHPFSVSNAAASMQGSLFELRNTMLQIVFVRSEHDAPEQMIQQAYLLDKIVRSSLATINENFLGDMNRVRELENKLDQWGMIRAEIFSAIRHGDRERAEKLVRTVGTAKFGEMVPLLDYIQIFANNKAKRFVKEAETQTEHIIFTMRCTIVLLTLFLGAAGVIIIKRVRHLQNILLRQATTDFLTGLPNRRHFMELAEREFARAMRYGKPFALVVADLDFFKKINDTYGHHVGDDILRKFSEICTITLRNSDVIGRTGGEEFAFLLPNTSLSEAQGIFERLKNSIETYDAEVGLAVPVRFTASFGLTILSPEDTGMIDLFRRADEALYEAKDSGRNRCVLRLSQSRQGVMDLSGVCI
jgi:diguanylate cyclase (GGDEF)-like protein